MATFEAQVEGLTSIDIESSNTYPTQAELTQFLLDGVIEVTQRTIAIDPMSAFQFQRESAEQQANGYDLGGPTIISVVRETGTDNDWRECSFIPPTMQSRVLEPTSFNYASAENPSYTILDSNKISVFPVPGSSNDTFKVYYVNNEPKGDGTSDSLAYGHSTLGYFPKDKTYLVVLYAAIKSIEAKLASYAIVEEDIELVQGLNTTLQTLTVRYESAFGRQASMPGEEGE